MPRGRPKGAKDLRLRQLRPLTLTRGEVALLVDRALPTFEASADVDDEARAASAALRRRLAAPRSRSIARARAGDLFDGGADG